MAPQNASTRVGALPPSTVNLQFTRNWACQTRADNMVNATITHNQQDARQRLTTNRMRDNLRIWERGHAFHNSTSSLPRWCEACLHNLDTIPLGAQVLWEEGCIEGPMKQTICSMLVFEGPLPNQRSRRRFTYAWLAPRPIIQGLYDSGSKNSCGSSGTPILRCATSQNRCVALTRS
jgi:hypothetical protein